MKFKKSTKHKLLLLCDGGSNQIALANKINEKFGLHYLILFSNFKINKKNILKKISLLMGHIFTKFVFKKSWKNMLDYYKSQFNFSDIKPNLTSSDVNSEEVINFIKINKPSLILVSGTNMLKKNTITIMHKYCKVMSLHTGISPYIKGGPNCTNWSLAIKQFNLIGNSIMWLNEGIDSGNLICTQQTKFNGNENYHNDWWKLYNEVSRSHGYQDNG